MSKSLKRKIRIKVNNAAALNEGNSKKQEEDEEEANLHIGRGRTEKEENSNQRYVPRKEMRGRSKANRWKNRWKDVSRS